MAAMLSGVITVTAFALVAATGLILAVALFRIGGHSRAGADTDRGQSDWEGG